MKLVQSCHRVYSSQPSLQLLNLWANFAPVWGRKESQRCQNACNFLAQCNDGYWRKTEIFQWSYWGKEGCANSLVCQRRAQRCELGDGAVGVCRQRWVLPLGQLWVTGMLGCYGALRHGASWKHFRAEVSRRMRVKWDAPVVRRGRRKIY